MAKKKVAKKWAKKWPKKWAIFWPLFLDIFKNRGCPEDPDFTFFFEKYSFLDFFQIFWPVLIFRTRIFENVQNFPNIAQRIFKSKKTKKVWKGVKKNHQIAVRIFKSEKNEKKNSKKSKKISRFLRFSTKSTKIWPFFGQFLYKFKADLR